MGVRKLKKKDNINQSPYKAITKIDGRHPFKDQVPGAYVDYPARIRPGGKVVYFNFGLAKEMGLIPWNHPQALNDDLTEILLSTFGLIIINEHDYTHKKKFDPETIKDHRYMATRYLQLQHPDKIGLRSGDGRSIWNGTFKGRKGITWDISSCGTGATCLSPAAVINDTFYKSGDKTISYGCGYSHLSEGVIDVIFSEIFNSNSIATERVLCVIEFPGGFGVTVRVGHNLLRPSHFFNHLRQEQPIRLKNSVDFFIDRELANGTWDKIPRGMNRYDYMLEKITETFANITAKFESEYIFCWLDWDGDNILANGGVIDFGSVRQFGLYHHSYRFDDDDRWSTNLKEQKYKAKHIIQSFAQIVTYLKTGKKKTHKSFKNHPALKRFDRLFTTKKRELFLGRIGIPTEWVEDLMEKKPRIISRLEDSFYYFETARSKKGPVKVPDGINWNAVYCMRSLLRVLPTKYQESFQPIEPGDFLKILKSSYADRSALRLSRYRGDKIKQFQKNYLALINWLAKHQGLAKKDVLDTISERSKVINRFQRITGDSICVLGDKFTKLRKKVSPKVYHKIMEEFLSRQTLDPDQREVALDDEQKNSTSKMLATFDNILRKYRDGI